MPIRIKKKRKRQSFKVVCLQDSAVKLPQVEVDGEDELKDMDSTEALEKYRSNFRDISWLDIGSSAIWFRIRELTAPEYDDVVFSGYGAKEAHDGSDMVMSVKMFTRAYDLGCEVVGLEDMLGDGEELELDLAERMELGGHVIHLTHASRDKPGVNDLGK